MAGHILIQFHEDLKYSKLTFTSRFTQVSSEEEKCNCKWAHIPLVFINHDV